MRLNHLNDLISLFLLFLDFYFDLFVVCLFFEEIIKNAEDKIENSECFSIEELVKLALTSLMPGTREGNIKQFDKLADMMDGIVFEDEDAKISFCGLVLLLSNIYFDANDSAGKRIQGVL